ncbi:MAG TPA: homoserine dehydrogenase [Polyangium sp.]|nr:homoserine dehydrogenase [Polyangium sp.]
MRGPANAEDPSTTSPRRGSIRLGLLGCGTVGGGVLELCAANARWLEGRVGAPLEVRRVLVRDPRKERVVACDPRWITTRPEDVVDDPEIDVVVEVMGGEGAALELVERAISAGKGVVTANKLLLAKHGPRLVDLAIARGTDLAFEGAVGGGIPIIRTLREAFASDWVERLVGIVNGTCNYVLGRMREGGLGLDEAVREAQAKGYAEADPSLDTGGHDAAHKLCVLAMLAFGARVPASALHVEGIEGIEERDHRYAERFGYVIKHLAIGRDFGDVIELRVHPTLIPKTSVLANVSGVLNAILLEGRALGPCMLYGRGAGDLPTAVSVVSDILDVGRSIVAGASGLLTRGIAMGPRPLEPQEDVETRYYLRLSAPERPGLMARIAGGLGELGVSLEQMVQPERPVTPGDPVDIVVLTHVAREGNVTAALERMRAEGLFAAPPRLFRIEVS